VRSKNPNIRKIGAWILLVGFVLVAIILPAGSPSAIVTAVFALIFILELVSPITLSAPQPTLCTGYRFGICPRSPPTC
jgi:hypothetical protein